VARRRRITLLADDFGLTQRVGSKVVTVSWEEASAVQVEAQRRGGNTYTLKGGVDDETISWSTNWDRTAIPLAGVQRLSSAELMAVVLHRSGKQLRVETV
jgi:hypothetical protein